MTGSLNGSHQRVFDSAVCIASNYGDVRPPLHNMSEGVRPLAEGMLGMSASRVQRTRDRAIGAACCLLRETQQHGAEEAALQLSGK